MKTHPTLLQNMIHIQTAYAEYNPRPHRICGYFEYEILIHTMSETSNMATPYPQILMPILQGEIHSIFKIQSASAPHPLFCSQNTRFLPNVIESQILYHCLRFDRAHCIFTLLILRD